MQITKLPLILALLCLSTLGLAQTVNNKTELNNAISSATPGTTIVLADGTWNNTFIDIDKDGTAAAPITITAENPGSVLMTGNSRVLMEGTYVIVSGLVFQNPSNLTTSGSTIEPVIELQRCNNCKVLNNKIDSYNGTEAQKSMVFKWIVNDGQRNEIAYNSFVGKYGVGSIINDNRNSSAADYLKIHHNYFADRTPINGVNEDNDQDAIRIGNSGTSLDDSHSEIYDNYFFNFFGEIEVISNKSGSNKYYNNTFRNYSGTLTLRHGDNCEVFGNYFFAEDNLFSGGVRVIGEGHKVYNNYIEGINSTKTGGATSNATGGINVTNGRPNTAINGYYQVKNATIVNNTFVNCDYALRIGTKVSSDLSLAPVNLIVANNITYNISDNDYQIVTTPTGTSISEGNLLDIPSTDMADDGKFHRLTSGSSPIGEGLGNYSFLNQDILEGDRDANFDAGAEEFGANGTKLPYTSADVGVKIGFGASVSPALSASPSNISIGKFGGTISILINSNVEWSISESISWLSVDITSGSGRTTINATIDPNSTGANRTGTITVDEEPGGSNLSTTINVTQLNTFLPVEITIIGATSKGMQDKAGIVEENAYNDNFTNYWTGNPDEEDEVSITFDLECEHELSEIGIHFWKADERTTTFSVAIANYSAGPFTTVIDNETSADTSNGYTADTEQRFSLEGDTARYVKFIGIGNSSTSNWTSIANINIYGDTNCLFRIPGSVHDQLTELGINIYPIPANGSITVVSDIINLNDIIIHTTSGQEVIRKDAQDQMATTIDISALSTGIYILHIEGLGHSKIVIR